jgi:heptosyltransferase II
MKKILIIRLSSLGDIVLTQSTVQTLRNEFPDVQIHYLTKKVFAPIVEMFNCVDEIHYWENKYKLLKNLRNIKFDLAIDLHSKFNTFIIKNFIKAKQTITYNKKHLLRRQIVKKRTNRTISSTVELYFTALEKIGIKVQISAPRLFPKKNVKLAKLLQTDDHKKYIGLFPGALHRTKQYPIKQLAEFIDSVPIEWNCQFIIFGSEAENNLTKELNSLTDTNIIDLCGKLNLQQLVVAIDKMEIVISNDSGPMHIAAALEKPQIAIFGATHPKLGFAPKNKNAILLSANLPCQPCSLHGGKKCPKEHFNCMRLISVEKILNSLKIIIN